MAGLGLVAVALAVAGAVVAPRLVAADPVVRTIAVGTTPLGVTVDPKTGHAFVIDNGDNSAGVIDTRTGTLLRTVRVGTGPTGMAVDERDGRVVVADSATSASQQTGQFLILRPLWSGSADVSILAARSGAHVATVSAAVSFAGVVADSHSGRVFVAMGDDSPLGQAEGGSIGVLPPAGTQIHHLATLPGTPLAMAVDGVANRAIVASEGGIVSILDATTGRLVRRASIGQSLPGQTIAVDEKTSRAFVLTANLNGDSGTVCVFDTHSGTLVRTVPLDSLPASIAVDATLGRAFIATIGPTTPVAVTSGYRPLAQRSTLPVSTGPGSLTTLDARSGVVIRSTQVGFAPGAVAVDAPHHHILVAAVGAMDNSGIPLGPGLLSVVDSRSGAVLHTVPVGVAPGDIAVDERAQRAIVLNMGGPVQRRDGWSWLPLWLRQRLPFLPQQVAATQTVPSTVTLLDTARL